MNDVLSIVANDGLFANVVSGHRSGDKKFKVGFLG
jgi:hypothetical protein